MPEDPGQTDATGDKSSSDRHDGPQVDPNAVRKSLTRLMEIYRDMSETADKQSISRCPYKDSRSRCTAKFDCRNQHFIADKPGEPAICVGSDKLDYRKAWQVE